MTTPRDYVTDFVEMERRLQNRQAPEHARCIWCGVGGLLPIHSDLTAVSGAELDRRVWPPRFDDGPITMGLEVEFACPGCDGIMVVKATKTIERYRR